MKKTRAAMSVKDATAEYIFAAEFDPSFTATGPGMIAMYGTAIRMSHKFFAEPSHFKMRGSTTLRSFPTAARSLIADIPPDLLKMFVDIDVTDSSNAAFLSRLADIKFVWWQGTPIIARELWDSVFCHWQVHGHVREDPTTVISISLSQAGNLKLLP